MPKLSNGQLIGVSSERARYHAMRRNIRIDRETPHHQLYALVDITIADDAVLDGSRRDAFRFSGHTLDDKLFVDSLSESDQRLLRDWLDQSHVRYEIEGARRKLIYDDLPATIQSHDYPQCLYSPLFRRIAAMPTMTLPARQWQQTLLNLRHKGISQDELHWSGLLSYLSRAAPDRKITRQSILDRMDFSTIRLEMTNELQAAQFVGQQAADRAVYRCLSLHGGEDYREWLISMPDYALSHFNAHFTERNILLHIRSKTRFDSLGRKLLFIEELQSDWHNYTVKKNYLRARVNIPAAPFRTSWVGLGLKLMLMHAVRHGFAGLSWADGSVQQYRYQVEIPAIRRIYDKAIADYLLKLSSKWQGSISVAELQTKVPWFRIKRLKQDRRMVNRHESIRCTGYDGCAINSLFGQYSRTIGLREPLFILPAGMREHIQAHGLPLFGEQLGD